MTRGEWIEALAHAWARKGPDEFPFGYYLFVATKAADEGDYDRYMAGEYAPGKLWQENVMMGDETWGELLK